MVSADLVPDAFMIQASVVPFSFRDVHSSTAPHPLFRPYHPPPICSNVEDWGTRVPCVPLGHYEAKVRTGDASIRFMVLTSILSVARAGRATSVNNLDGTLPAELGKLTDLELLCAALCRRRASSGGPAPTCRGGAQLM